MMYAISHCFGRYQYDATVNNIMFGMGHKTNVDYSLNVSSRKSTLYAYEAIVHVHHEYLTTTATLRMRPDRKIKHESDLSDRHTTKTQHAKIRTKSESYKKRDAYN